MLRELGVSEKFEVNVGLGQGSTLSPVLFTTHRDGTDKQKDWYEQHIPEANVRKRLGSGSGGGDRSPRTIDRVESYVQQTRTESKFVKDGGNVGGADMKSLADTWRGRSSIKETVLYTWVERYVSMATETPKSAGGL